MPQGARICGVTTLDNHLYVLRGNKSTEQIEVYDINSYLLLRCVTVPVSNVRKVSLGDIVACGHNRCAYISDYAQCSVHRVALPGATVTQWPVNGAPHGLSLTATHSVLVSCCRVRKVKEFSTDGQLLHVLILPHDIASLSHTVQLSRGKCIVCHGQHDEPSHRVCHLGSDGSVARSYGGPKGSGSLRMNTPSHMAVDRKEFVFVADVGNHRVLLLSPMLTYVREVVSREQIEWWPYTIHLDSARQHLYVAENEFKDDRWTAGRILVVSI